MNRNGNGIIGNAKNEYAIWMLGNVLSWHENNEQKEKRTCNATDDNLPLVEAVKDTYNWLLAQDWRSNYLEVHKLEVHKLAVHKLAEVMH